MDFPEGHRDDVGLEVTPTDAGSLVFFQRDPRFEIRRTVK